MSSGVRGWGYAIGWDLTHLPTCVQDSGRDGINSSTGCSDLPRSAAQYDNKGKIPEALYPVPFFHDEGIKA